MSMDYQSLEIPAACSLAGEEVVGVGPWGVTVFGEESSLRHPQAAVPDWATRLHNWGQTSPVGITNQLSWYDCGQLMLLCPA